MYLWMIATIVAYFIKGLCGFANTLVFTTILSFGVANVNISPIDLLLGYPANLFLTWENRKKLNAKVYLPLSLMVLTGSIPGALLLKNADTRVIKLIFIVDNTFRIILYSMLHVLTPVTAGKSRQLFPFALAGLLAGIKCSHQLDEKVARKITAALLVLSGISLILKNLQMR